MGNGYYNDTCFNDLKGLYDSNNKYIVKSNWDFQRIIQTSPNNIEINFLDLKNVDNLDRTSIKPSIKIQFDTQHIRNYTQLFSDYDQYFYKRDPYQYDLDWVYIKKGAIISEMFDYTKFSKKLPRMETKISFNEFVKRTGLIVTPELLENNDMSVDKWCKTKHNKKLMKNNKQYEPMLEYWLNSDFITAEEKIEAMEESGIEIFDI